jgi:hypothetical protein
MNTALQNSLLVVCVALLATLRCSLQPLAGGGTIETTNGRVEVSLANETGTPAARTQVQLFSADHDPLTDTSAIPVRITDSAGKCFFDKIDSGVYTLNAVQLAARTRAITQEIRVSGDTVTTRSTLRKPGKVRVALPESIDYVNGYLYIPGTAVYSELDDADSTITLDSVPASIIPAILYAVMNKPSATRILRDSVPVVPEKTTIVPFPDWTIAKKIVLNTAASGANVPGDVTGFPVLLRLNLNNFNFALVKQNGQDLRFTRADGTPLPFEIERWDALSSTAEVWVRIDTVHGNDSTQYFMMYAGNKSASVVSAQAGGAAVFESSDGFQAVWHLGENAGAINKDATVNHFDGALNDSLPTAVSGIIGTCRKFNGTSNFITIPGSASGKLNFPENGYYTISAWAFIDSMPASTDYIDIVAKGNRQYHLQSTVLGWKFSEFQEAAGGWSNTISSNQIGQWAYVTGVRAGARQFLYVNGSLTDSSITIAPDPSPPAVRETSFDVSIGRFNRTPFYYFPGALDEVRISNTARSADWEKLCYMNQKSADNLVGFNR